MGNNRNIRLIDIANTLGYTVNTVSRALRDKPDIGFETKQLVKETAMKMGYIPNSIASSLRSGSSNTVAIVFDNMVNPYFMIMADKLHKQLELLGYATMIFAAHNIQLETDALNPIISRKVDGIITFLEPTEEVLKTCENNQIPIILIGRKNTKLKIDSVATDDFLGGYEVGKLLVEKGSKNIGYLGAEEEVECSVRRRNGLKKCLEDLKISFNETNFRYIKNGSLKDDLIDLINNKVDAIFFFNDVMALEAIKLLNENNLSVPSDVKIVGYDDIQSEFLLPVNLTTVATDKDKIVLTTVELLYEKMQKGNLNQLSHFDFDVHIKLGNTV